MGIPRFPNFTFLSALYMALLNYGASKRIRFFLFCYMRKLILFISFFRMNKHTGSCLIISSIHAFYNSTKPLEAPECIVLERESTLTNVRSTYCLRSKYGMMVVQ